MTTTPKEIPSRVRLIKNLESAGIAVEEVGEQRYRFSLGDSHVLATIRRGTCNLYRCKGKRVLDICLLLLPCLTGVSCSLVINKTVSREFKTMEQYIKANAALRAATKTVEDVVVAPKLVSPAKPVRVTPARKIAPLIPTARTAAFARALKFKFENWRIRKC